VRVWPTTKLAAQVFSVGPQLVLEAVRDLAAIDVGPQPRLEEFRDLEATPTRDTAPAAPSLELGHLWSGLTDAQRDAFTRQHLHTIWSAIERVTA
jgi:hypothetical protein